jgi:hypothetical protein
MEVNKSVESTWSGYFHVRMGEKKQAVVKTAMIILVT